MQFDQRKKESSSVYFAFLALSTSLAVGETHSSGERAICYIKQIIIQNNEHIEELLFSQFET